MTPEPCKWCGDRRWIVMGEEVAKCWCVKELEAKWDALLPTDLTTETSSLRGRRDALRHEAGE